MMTVHFIWVILVRYGAIYNKMPKKFWDLSAAAYVPYRKLDILGLLESQCFRKASDTSKQTSITGDWQQNAKESTTRISRYLGLAWETPNWKRPKRSHNRPYTSWLFMTFWIIRWLAGPSLGPLELASGAWACRAMQWDSDRFLCGRLMEPLPL